MFPWNKGPDLKSMVADYLEKAEECIERFAQTVDEHLKSPFSVDFNELVEKTHIAESFCDDIRRKIEHLMYEKALIPESREAVLNLLERLDKVPNKAESVCYRIQSELIEVPAKFADDFRQLVRVNQDTFMALSRSVRVLFENTNKVRPFTDEVDKLESACDTLERRLIRAIFSSEQLPGHQKLLLRDLVESIAGISDRSETAADVVDVIAITRIV